MKKIQTLIVDDEKPARDQIVFYLKNDERFEIAGVCSDGFEALKQIHNQKPDLVFLDVQMPKLTGFEMLELLDNPPMVVFSTAYDEYALKAFEVHAVDYLLKPYTRKRFNNTLERVMEKYNASAGDSGIHEISKSYTNLSGKLHRIVIKHNGRIVLVPVKEIKYLETMDDYVAIHTSDARYLKQKPMKFFEDNLDAELFVRIHRSYMVNLEFVTRIEPYGKETWKILLNDNIRLAVSRSGMKRLSKQMDFGA